MLNAAECFFTSTSWCLVPVTTVDKRPVGDGAVGPVTQQLLAAWSENVGLDIVDQALRYGSRHCVVKVPSGLSCGRRHSPSKGDPHGV